METAINNLLSISEALAASLPLDNHKLKDILGVDVSLTSNLPFGKCQRHIEHSLFSEVLAKGCEKQGSDFVTLTLNPDLCIPMAELMTVYGKPAGSTGMDTEGGDAGIVLYRPVGTHREIVFNYHLLTGRIISLTLIKTREAEFDRTRILGLAG